MQDIRELDGRGIPGGYVASSAFMTAADSQGELHGFHPSRVFVHHPIQDRTDDELRALADEAFTSVWAMVCAGAPPDAP